MSIYIRPAAPHEASLLSDLALRSKAHWGYPPDFIAACRDALTVSTQHILENAVFVAQNADGKAAGFYLLIAQAEGTATLEMLFIAPEAMGQGCGRALFDHAVQVARAGGCREIQIDSDPYAESFYLRMGAERIGEAESTVVPGRMLPLLRCRLRPVTQSG